MANLVPVDHDPFAGQGGDSATFNERFAAATPPRLVPVDHDPFSETSTAADAAKSLGSGLAEGVVGLPGLPGDVAGLIHQAGTPLVQAGMNRWASPEAAGRFALRNAMRSSNPLPTSEDIIGGAEKATGIERYHPQTRTGEFLHTVGEFAPNVIGGPESLLAKTATRVVAPGIASEAAGQATKGTALEPYARIAGAVAGHAGAKGLERTPEINAPSIEDLHEAASQGYRNARGYGVEIRRQPVSRLADDIFSDLGNDGFRERNVPKTWDAIGELKNPIGRHVTVDDLDSVRKALNRAGANPMEGAEREASRRAIGAIDNYLSNLDPAHVAVNPHFAGDVAGEIGDARANWAAMKRGEQVENKLESALDQTGATGSGSNINNVTRQKIKQILANPGQLRGFSPPEVAQMRRVVRGTVTGNVTRKLGKLAPEGVVSGALGIDLGLAVAGSSPMALGVPLLGKIAKTIGDASTARQARRLSQMVRARSPLGATLPQQTPPAPLSVRGLVRSGTFGGLAGQEQGGGFASGGHIKRAEGGPTDDDLSPEDQALASSMTHWPEAKNSTIEEANRRLKLTGQNLYNSWIAPAERLGRAATSGTLDVTDPQTAGDAFGLVGTVAGARMPFAGSEIGAVSGRGLPQTVKAYKGAHPYENEPDRDWRGNIIKSYGELQERDLSKGASSAGHAGFFSSDPEVANRFSIAESQQPAVFPVNIAFKRPMIIEGEGKPAAAWQFDSVAREHGMKEELEAVRSALHPNSEYDGVIVRNTKDEGDVYIPKQGSQITSQFAPNVLPRNLGPARPNRPINEQTLAEMRELQAQLDKGGFNPPGRPINEQTLREMRGADALTSRDYPALLKAHGPEFQNASVIDHQGNVLHNPLSRESIGGPMLRINEDGSVTRGIIAYHGSPHDFDRFDVSKIGTGEGAQAYGHGLYFAEHPDVAKGYQRNVSRTGLDQYEMMANEILRQEGDNREAAIARAKELEEKVRQQVATTKPWATYLVDEASRTRQLIERGWTPPKGKMYQVSIKADPEHFLDWDKPLSEQSEKVRDFLKTRGIKPSKFGPADPTMDELAKNPKWTGRWRGNLPDDPPWGDEYDGETVWSTMRRLYPNLSEQKLQSIADEIKWRSQNGQIPESMTGQRLYDVIRQNLGPDIVGSPEKATQALRAAGIPGIKYLDQGSRAGGEGTRNFVVFDDKLIDIMKKYGIAGIGALPALGMYHYQDKDIPKGRARGGRVPGELTESNKATHEEVGYVSVSPRKKQRCELCWKFIPASEGGPSCLKIQSPIAAAGWCRRFVRDSERIERARGGRTEGGAVNDEKNASFNKRFGAWESDQFGASAPRGYSHAQEDFPGQSDPDIPGDVLDRMRGTGSGNPRGSLGNPLRLGYPPR